MSKKVNRFIGDRYKIKDIIPLKEATKPNFIMKALRKFLGIYSDELVNELYTQIDLLQRDVTMKEVRNKILIKEITKLRNKLISR